MGAVTAVCYLSLVRVSVQTSSSLVGYHVLFWQSLGRRIPYTMSRYMVLMCAVGLGTDWA